MSARKGPQGFYKVLLRRPAAYLKLLGDSSGLDSKAFEDELSALTANKPGYKFGDGLAEGVGRRQIRRTRKAAACEQAIADLDSDDVPEPTSGTVVAVPAAPPPRKRRRKEPHVHDDGGDDCRI